jgi:hypothetical protein
MKLSTGKLNSLIQSLLRGANGSRPLRIRFFSNWVGRLDPGYRRYLEGGDHSRVSAQWLPRSI